MKYFKRFTDVISGVALLNVVIYLIGKFSIYMKNSDMTFSERLESFLEPKATGEYRTYFFIAVFLILSIVGGRIFERFPTLALAASLPAFVHTLVLFGRRRLHTQPMFYIVITALAVVGNILYALSLDRIDGKRRAYRCSNLCGVLGLVLAYWVYDNADTYRGMEFSELSKLDRLHIELARTYINEDEGIIYKIAILMAISLVVSFFLRDIYFLDAAVALPPCVYSFYMVATGELSTFIAISAAVPFLYFLAKLLLVFFEPTLKYYLPWKNYAARKGK